MQQLTDASSDALAQMSSLLAEASHALGALTEPQADAPYAASPSPAGPRWATPREPVLDEERVLA
jgi:hypothetical protein